MNSAEIRRQKNANPICYDKLQDDNNYSTREIHRLMDNAKIRRCEKCDFECCKDSDWNRHISTRKHNESLKSAELRRCEKCDFECCKESDWNRHISTRKHIGLMNTNDTVNARQKNAETDTPSKTFDCICGKEYLHLPSLHKHRKTCDVYLENSTGRVSDNSANTTIIQGIPPEIVLKIITENTKLQQDFMLEVMKNNNGNSIVSSSHNTTNSHNKFNLNFFLNEQCKNAMNITDFANNIQIGIDDLENVGRTGYVKGITDIIVKNLNGMDVHDRPIHCTDLKRETLYIRDDDKWDKENPDKTKLRKCIKTIANKNEAKISDWCTENPQCMTNNHPSNDFYLSMYKNVLGGVGRDQQDKYDNTIIKNVSKSIIVEKPDN